MLRIKINFVKFSSFALNFLKKLPFFRTMLMELETKPGDGDGGGRQIEGQQLEKRGTLGRQVQGQSR